MADFPLPPETRWPAPATPASSPSRRSATRAAPSRSASGSACGRASGCSPAARPTCASRATTSRSRSGPSPILVVRQRDGSHRGAITTSACTAATGCARRAAATPSASRARSTAGSTRSTARCAARSTRSLPAGPAGASGSGSSRCAARPGAGFVFVSLDPDAEPLRDYLGVVPEHLDALPLRRVGDRERRDASRSPCNWKTSVDAFNEAYHIAATHPWTLEFSDDVEHALRLLRAPHAHDLPRGAAEPAPSRPRHDHAAARRASS